MEALAQQAGAGHVVRSYLDARSISSVGTLAMLAKDDEAFEASIVRPLLDGFVWTRRNRSHSGTQLSSMSESAAMSRRRRLESLSYRWTSNPSQGQCCCTCFI